MNNTQLYFLIAAVISVMAAFIFGMFYITKKLKEEKSVLNAVALPLIVGFCLAIILLVVAFGMM